MERQFKLIKKAGRKHLLIRWHDGERWREKSSGVSRRRDAERIARGLIEAEQATPAGDWLDCRLAYERDHLSGLSDNYRATFVAAARKLEEMCSPKAVSDVTPAMLTRFQAAMRDAGLAKSTIASYLIHLRGALNWAKRNDYTEMAVRVEVPRQRGGGKMRGRPLTGEEFERLLAAAEKLLRKNAKPTQDVLRGFWLSGFRRKELAMLSWDDRDAPMVVDIDHRRPMVTVPAALDKARKGATVPLTPDFVAFLRTLPQRSGRVFRPVSKTGKPLASPDAIGRLISSIGEASGVVVEKGRHPTAHDLRRSFGSRWAMKVTPAVLKELMRHEDIKTTMTFYVGQSAERTANEVWDAFGRAQGGVLGGAAVGEAEQSSAKV